MIWFFLFLLGLVLYLIVQYSITRVTRTPGWLLWLVLMMPAFLVGFWAATQSPQQPIPPVLLIGSFLVSSLLYIVLVRQNRKLPPSPARAGAAQAGDPPTGKQALSPASTKLSPLSPAEESQLKTCFPWSTYYLQEIDHRPQAVICRGQLRSQPEEAYQTIQQNIHNQFGDRFLVIFQQGIKNKPFFALVPNPQAPSSRRPARAKFNRPTLAGVLLVATLVTTTVAGVELAKPTITAQSLQANPNLLWLGLPYALALMTILGMHELGHYITARFYKIKATLPCFIPIPFAFGTFGAFIQMRSPVPNRKALFDVGIAGPLVGFLVTLPVLLWGLSQSHLAELPDNPNLLSLEAFSPQSSILMALLCKAVFGGQLTAANAIHLSPVAVAGWLGLVITALNLMPVGQLDGGHIVHAMFGQRTGAIIGQVTRLLVLLLSFIQRPLLLWAIILLFMPTADEPALNDVSELNNSRDLLGLLALGLLLLIILPVPHSVIGVLFA